MKNIVYTLALAAITICAPTHAHEATVAGPTPDQALSKLMAGNALYMSPEATSCHRITQEERFSVVAGQHPFAIVLSCSDSRVPTELIFNETGLSEIFTIRNAGNVIDDISLGSIEYGVKHLNIPLILVMGHQSCGAVTAAVNTQVSGKPLDPSEGHIQSIVDTIAPAIGAETESTPAVIATAVKANVESVIKQLSEKSPMIAAKIKAGTLKVAGAYYHLDTGAVELLK